MGLTASSVGRGARRGGPGPKGSCQTTVALLGNPNVGKSTLFNRLTGLHQHTGNWPGKTVTLAQGTFRHKNREFHLVDLPGTYSLHARSPEEQVAADYLSRSTPDCTVVVCDATALRRSLPLVLQALAVTKRIVVCVNLMDEAEKAGMKLDLRVLEDRLGIPVVGTAAGREKDLRSLQEAICAVASGKRTDHARVLAGDSGFLSEVSEKLAMSCIIAPGERPAWQRRLDRFLTGKCTGTLAMLLLLLCIFWLTIVGANYPSMALQGLFDHLYLLLKEWLSALPPWISGALLDGVYATTARVVSVMLPPMAIFFPLFTLLEDFGYLPRVAFLLDAPFERCGSCGRQGLSMCMGFGCNAAGVVGCRIISSPRERLIAIVTNSLVPCNGRFPLLIGLIAAFFSAGSVRGLGAAAMLTGLVLLSIVMTFLVSGILSKTVLCGAPSAFLMELPPFRKPRIGEVLVRSLLDRTVFVLGRAAAVAAPAGLVIWLCSSLQVGGAALTAHVAAFLQPLGALMGLSGGILTAFLLGFPANELVLPMILTILAVPETVPLAEALRGAGWTEKTALCTMLFCLFHWPCSTTLLTVYRETGSKRWTLAAAAIPTVIGVLLCMLCNFLTA